VSNPVTVGSGADFFGTPWKVSRTNSSLLIKVGPEEIELDGGQAGRFAEAVARAVTPGQEAHGG
jgi:hypothetical protein